MSEMEKNTVDESTMSAGTADEKAVVKEARFTVTTLTSETIKFTRKASRDEYRFYALLPLAKACFYLDCDLVFSRVAGCVLAQPREF